MATEKTTIEGLEVSAEFAALIVLDRKPTVPELAKAAAAYYAMPDNGAGGSLHVVLDDQNIDTYFVERGIEWAKERGDNEGILLGKMLLNASKTQRSKLVYNCYF